MHQQIRVSTALSPANAEAALAVLERAGIDILSVGGSNVESGGELAIGVDDKDYQKAFDALVAAHYKPQLVPVYLEFLPPHQVGALRACVGRAKQKNQGKTIRDIAIGVTGADGKVPVQVYFE